MFSSIQINEISSQVSNQRERDSLKRSLADHMRNGRGFWPVVTIDGEPQVVRFAGAQMGLWGDERWYPETGAIDVIPLHALPVADWPRVRMGMQ